MALALTAHARTRIEQRAIAPEALDELFDWGREAFDHRTILYFGADARRRLGRHRARFYAVLFYRILLTRAMSGCYLWIEDEETRNHVLASLGCGADARIE